METRDCYQEIQDIKARLDVLEQPRAGDLPGRIWSPVDRILAAVELIRLGESRERLIHRPW